MEADMATLNRLQREYTHEGAPSPRIDAVSQLERSVMSCLLWEDTFYEDGKSIAERIITLCAQVPASEVARIAIQAKEDMRLRHVPLLLARELAKTKEGKAELKTLLPRVILRPDDITEFLAIYWKDGKKPLAKQVKKWLGESFRKFTEYQLQKYNGGSKAVKLSDALKITRPKPIGEEQQALWGRLIKGELATPDTWEVAISKTADKTAEWTRLLSESKLGGLAMLRNIRNMREAKVDDTAIANGISAIQAGKLLPINFITSARHNPQFEAQLEQKFFECFNKPKHSGKTIILVDVSGSMDDRLAGRSELQRLDVACSLAMIGREIFQDCRIMTFSNQVVEVPARRGFALRDAIVQSQQHGGTALGQAVATIVANAQFDRLIVITDEQSRDSVPQVKGYMINVASNKNGVGYGSWLHIDGWSDKVLDYIMRYENNKD
jgi:60 kDa SS-A/Ro ribonucleoprotein